MDVDGRGVGEDLKGVEGREVIIRISSIKILFSIKEKDLFIFSLTLLFLKYLYQTFLYMLD